MLIEHLKDIDNMYDLMALCGKYILNIDKETPCDFSEFDDEMYDNVYDAIEAYCYARKDKGKKSAFAEFKSFIIDFLKREVNAEKCYAIVKYVDDLVEVEFTGHLLESSDVIEYSQLNKLYGDDVCIVPKVKDNFFLKKAAQMRSTDNTKYDFFRKARQCAGSILDKDTVNYIIWDKERIEKYPFIIYHCNKEHFITKHFLNADKLTFGIVPFTDRELNEIFDIKYGNKTFEIIGMKPLMEQKLKEKYKDIYERCEGKNIDFLIFPEMLMTESIMDSALKREGHGSPWLVVNGSIWKSLVNRAYVTDGKGEKIFGYCKKEPFVYRGIYTEHLDKSQNLEYAILDVEKFGRIGVAICKDLLNEDIKMFHKYMGTNLLLVPAYTESMDLQSAAGELSRDYNCIVVVANACSALKKNCQNGEGKRIGFISLPAKMNTDRKESINMYFQDKCVETCQKCCAGKIISIDFNRKNDLGISYMLEESTF